MRSGREACLRIVDVRGIMGRTCAKQWGAHVQSNGVRMAMARVNGACAKQLGNIRAHNLCHDNRQLIVIARLSKLIAINRD